MNQQLALIDRAFAIPLDLTTQLNRLPPIDAPCPCQHDPCHARFPFCVPDEGDEDA